MKTNALESMVTWVLTALMVAASTSASLAGTTAFIDINNAQGTPPGPDGNGNYWNVLDAIGPSVNLIDSSNAATGWSAAISTVASGGNSGFSGVGLNNTVAAPAPYNVQQAYADAWYDNTPGRTNGQFTFSGLDGSSTYRLELWGNRSGWNDGTVTVTTGTPTGPSTLQQNTVLELNVVPDASNQITFMVDEAAGGSAGGNSTVLNLMSIEEIGPLPKFQTGTMLIDFGKLGQETTTYNGKTWNNAARSPGTITSTEDLVGNAVTTDGAVTATNLRVINPPTNGFGIGGSDSTNDATGLGYPLSASRDQLYITSGWGPVQLELRNLATDGTTYDLTMFGTLNPGGNRTSKWGAGGTTKTLDVGGNTTEVVTFTGLLPNAVGTIPIVYDHDTSGAGGSGVWSVFELQAHPGAGPTQAASISVNMQISSNDNNSVNVDESAVTLPAGKGIAGQYWNAVVLRDSGTGAPGVFTAATQGGNAITLYDDTGAAAGTMTSSGSFWSQWSDATDGANRGVTGEAGLVQSFINLNDTETVTIDGLSEQVVGSAYKVVLFCEPGELGRTMGLSVVEGAGGRGVNQTTWFRARTGQPDGDGDDDGYVEWVQATGAGPAGATVDGNYIVVDGLTAGSFTIRGTNVGGRSIFNGLQILPSDTGPAAEAISINFARDTASPDWTVLDPSDGAGIVSRGNWNNVDIDSGLSFGPIALVDATGQTTGATIESTLQSGWAGGNNGNGRDTPNREMMNASLFYNAGDQGHLIIDNLPESITAEGFNVYLYFESNDDGRRNMTFSIDGVSHTGFDGESFQDSDTFLLAGGSGINANYMLWENLRGSSFTIEADSDFGRAGIAGIQIVANVPEPATMALLSVAACGLGGYVRKRRRA